MIYVLECFSNVKEYEKRVIEKCNKVCGNFKRDIKYKYYCMLDFIYKYLIEMCVILEYVFGNEFFFFFSIYYIKYCFRIIYIKFCMYIVNILI